MKKCRLIVLSLLISLSFVFSGCGKVVFSTNLKGNVMVSYGSGSITDRQVKLIALNYKAEYENYYEALLGAGFWNQSVTQETDFEQYVKEYYIWSECNYLTGLLEVANQRGIKLTEAEKLSAQTNATEYFNHLTDDERNFVQIDLEQTQDLFEKYKLAEQTISSLSEGNKAEVSDEQSRVIDIQILHVSSKELADTLKARIDAGESFADLADENTLDVKVNYSVGRGDLCDPFDSVIFSMSQGQVSDVITFHETYYIIRCSNIYNTLNSEIRKSNLLTKQVFDNWDEIMLQDLNGKQVTRNAASWNELTLQGEGEYIHFDLYEYMNK